MSCTLASPVNIIILVCIQNIAEVVELNRMKDNRDRDFCPQVGSATIITHDSEVINYDPKAQSAQIHGNISA